MFLHRADFNFYDSIGELGVKSKISKYICLILAVCMVISLTGCGNLSTNGSSNQGKKNTKSDTGEKLRMITWTNEGTIEALNTINDRFYKETGIEVTLIDVPSADYEDLLKARMESGDVDIFCYTSDSKAFAQPQVDWAPSELPVWEEIIKDGKALDLSSYAFLKNWNSGAEACSYDGGIYGIATGMTIMNGIFYNKKLFNENGWQEPKTWNEFVALCETIKGAGIAPIIVGGADTWPVQMVTNAIVDSVEEGNNSELSEALWKGNRKYTDERSMEIYRRELQILSFMADDFLNISYADAPSYFVDGKAAMFYAGSWNAADIEDANPEFEYDYFAIPGDKKHNFTGKYDLTFGINATSPYSEAAVKWLEYFSQPDIYTIYINSNGFVPTMSWISTSNKFLVLIDDRIKDADRTFECYNRVPDNYGYGTYDLINYKIAGGEFDTPEAFAEAAQKDWDAAISAAANNAVAK